MGGGAETAAGKHPVLSLLSACTIPFVSPVLIILTLIIKQFNFEISQESGSRHTQSYEQKQTGTDLGFASNWGCQNLCALTSSGATCMQQLLYQLSHYLHKKPHFQVPRNKLQMGSYVHAIFLQKWIVEAYKLITNYAALSQAHFPSVLAKLAWMSYTMETPRSPNSFRLCPCELTMF